MFENKPNKLQRRSFLCFMSDFRFCYYISMPNKAFNIIMLKMNNHSTPFV